LLLCCKFADIGHAAIAQANDIICR
jgi:hypothetical protein